MTDQAIRLATLEGAARIDKPMLKGWLLKAQFWRGWAADDIERVCKVLNERPLVDQVSRRMILTDEALEKWDRAIDEGKVGAAVDRVFEGGAW